MKRTLKVTFSLVLLFLVGLFLTPVNVIFAEEKVETSEYASYQEKEILEKNDLSYGIEHIKVSALSTANRCNNQSNTTLSPQVVNILSVPSRQDVRVVCYTYPKSNGWTKQTLTNCVKSFENTHPGWVVIAGVNGDFYDINGKDKALPYHTTGSLMTDGELLRTVESKSIGYKNDGSMNSFASTEKLSFTSYHILTIYDEEDNVIGSFQVDKLNSQPIEGEIAVYYTHRKNVSDENGTTAELVSVDVPKNNSYIIQMPERCLPTISEVYAKGNISSTNEEMTLSFGQFAIVTSNEEVTKMLKVGTKVRVQKGVSGDLADCNQIQAVGSTLMKNGEISTDNSDGMRYDRHPRTFVGVKEDGTLMFFTVDGRQLPENMYGMTQDEEGVVMKYYGCYEGYNIDGGGSTTIGIRNENGEFVVKNSPSDGRERSNSNFILITVPELKLDFSEQSDTSVKLSYGNLSKGISISNVKVTIDSVTKEMNNQEFVFDGLKPETEYKIDYQYDISYGGKTQTKVGAPLTFKTGKLAPSVYDSSFDIVKGKIKYKFSIKDDSNIISMVSFSVDSKLEFIDNYIGNTFEYNVNDLKNIMGKVTINYNVESEPNRSGKITETIKWYPMNISEKNVCQEKLSNIVNEVNQQLGELSKEEMVAKIFEAQEEIANGIGHNWKDATTEAPKTCTVCGTIEGEKLPTTKNNCKGCKKSSVGVILSGISLLCVSIYVIRKKK